MEIHERCDQPRQQRDLDRVTDDQATLSIGSIAIQPGNTDPTQTVVLAGTGEADNSADSYFGLGILRSADGGNTWTLISTANNGTYSFSGLGATRMAFSTASGQTGTVVAAMAATSEGVTDGALTASTYRGLYTSTDAGQTWTYDALFSGSERGDLSNFGGVQRRGRSVFRGRALSRLLLFVGRSDLDAPRQPAGHCRLA